MTVKELIDELKKYDGDLKVVLDWGDEGIVYNANIKLVKIKKYKNLPDDKYYKEYYGTHEITKKENYDEEAVYIEPVKD